MPDASERRRYRTNHSPPDHRPTEDVEPLLIEQVRDGGMRAHVVVDGVARARINRQTRGDKPFEHGASGPLVAFDPAATDIRLESLVSDVGQP